MTGWRECQEIVISVAGSSPNWTCSPDTGSDATGSPTRPIGARAADRAVARAGLGRTAPAASAAPPMARAVSRLRLVRSDPRDASSPMIDSVPCHAARRHRLAANTRRGADERDTTQRVDYGTATLVAGRCCRTMAPNDWDRWIVRYANHPGRRRSACAAVGERASERRCSSVGGGGWVQPTSRATASALWRTWR